MESIPFDVPEILRCHRGAFNRGGRWRFRPKMKYHVLADGVFWSDEFPAAMPPDLENAFRMVLNHRTSLLVGESGRFEEAWHAVQLHFPSWRGLSASRCTFDPVIANRIARIRRVSNWRIEKLAKDFEGDNPPW